MRHSVVLFCSSSHPRFNTNLLHLSRSSASSNVSPVQALTLSIHDNAGHPLSLLCCPAIVPCMMSFSIDYRGYWFPQQLSKIGQLSSFRTCQKVSIYSDYSSSPAFSNIHPGFSERELKFSAIFLRH